MTPEPEPDPPTPTSSYNFEITNEMSQSYYFMILGVYDDGEFEKHYSIVDSSSLTGLHESVSLSFDTIPTHSGYQFMDKVIVGYSTTPSGGAGEISWNQVGSQLAISDLVGKTFKGTFRGNQLSNTWVIE